MCARAQKDVFEKLDRKFNVIQKRLNHKCVSKRSRTGEAENEGVVEGGEEEDEEVPAPPCAPCAPDTRIPPAVG